MNLRIVLARFMLRIGRFVQSLSISIMRPDDLVEFNRIMYSRKESLKLWNQDNLLNEGLYPEENTALEQIPLKKGRLLLLGLGGGREAIALSKRGFAVTGIDFIPEMTERAKKNALQIGVQISTLVQDIQRLDLPQNSFDVAWLFASMYSSVPTRRRRIEMLQRIRNALIDGGYFTCQFLWTVDNDSTHKMQFARKIFAYLTFGNFRIEKGDILWGNQEFLHAFYSRDELQSEFKEGGFEVVDISIPIHSAKGTAILRKS